MVEQSYNIYLLLDSSFSSMVSILIYEPTKKCVHFMSKHISAAASSVPHPQSVCALLEYYMVH